MKKINKPELLKLVSKFSKKRIKNDNDLKTYLLDSLSMMKIVLEIEKFYGIEITKNLESNSFASIKNIIKLINDNKKRNKK